MEEIIIYKINQLLTLDVNIGSSDIKKNESVLNFEFSVTPQKEKKESLVE